ncbi:MAG: 50S ribosomal protein L4 [Lentisphaerae bacterium]|nr:50S ribosomal protein L4 [Lentisphaerota bacterium]
MKLDVYNTAGEAAGAVELADGLLVRDKGGQAVHEAVTATRAAGRAGTASTLSKGEVAGSNRKPWRQKGTGRARAGYRQSPLWRGGAVVFGPRPRDYRKKINRKVARLAFRRALSDRLAEGGVKVVEAFDLPEARTRHFAALMKALGVTAPALFVSETVGPELARAARNVPGVALARAADVGVYELVRYPLIVADRSGLAVLEGRLSGSGGKKETAA